MLVLVVAAAVAAALRGGFTDLFVYQYGGQAVLDGLAVYESDDPVRGLPFTYPPFAAVLMVPLAPLPTWLAAALWTGASMGALAAAIVVVRRALGRPAPGWLVALLTGGALALEPVWQNLTFGQVNVFLMLAVLVDLVRPERRWSGVLVGIVAGAKLTPLVFVVLLVLVGRRTAAGRAALAFVGTVAVGFVAMPGSSVTYWTDGLVDAERVGPPALAHNQSVYGALTRLLDGPPPTWAWLAVAGPLSLAVLVLAAAWWRRGDRLLGTCLGAVAMLLASPVSWSHHWVWAVPVALVLWERSRWTSICVDSSVRRPPHPVASLGSGPRVRVEPTRAPRRQRLPARRPRPLGLGGGRPPPGRLLRSARDHLTRQRSEYERVSALSTSAEVQLRWNHHDEGMRILVRASTLAIAWMLFYVVADQVSTSKGDANIGLGLLAFGLLLVGAGIWGVVDGSRHAFAQVASYLGLGRRVHGRDGPGVHHVDRARILLASSARRPARHGPVHGGAGRRTRAPRRSIRYGDEGRAGSTTADPDRHEAQVRRPR